MSAKTNKKDASGPKLRVAVIGVGGMGGWSVDKALDEQIVAFCDVDEKYIAEGLKKIAAHPGGAHAPAIYYDYRKMLDDLHGSIDVVLIGTPDHHHAPAAIRAIDLGIATFCQKPLAHNIYECYALARAAREKGVLTQMGNQGHCGEPIRRACEYIWAGAIGNVLETHTILGRNFGGRGGRRVARPVPEGLHWDEWDGPAPFRSYHAKLHPFDWRSWRQFGTGTIGDMACHNLDSLFWALHVADANEVQVECIATNGGSEQMLPQDNIVRYDVPARGSMVPFSAYVYDHTGLKPEILCEAEREHGVKFGEGTLYIGDKGIFYTGGTGSDARILPRAKHDAFGKPPRKLPRAHGEDPIDDLFHAIRHGGTPCSNFPGSAAPLTSFALLGYLAQCAGPGVKLDWNVEQMRCTNVPDVNRYVRRRYRSGWEV